MEYLLHCTCPNCEEEIYERGLNLIEENGLPVFDLDQFSQTSMECPKCGWEGGTGDIDIETFEEGEEQEDD